MTNSDFGNAIVNAADAGRAGEIKHLIASGTSPNQRGFVNITPLMRAAFKGHKQVAKLLLESGADPYAKDDGGATALHYAVRAGNQDIVEMLVNAGSDFASKDHLGFSAAARAHMMNRKEIVSQHQITTYDTPLEDITTQPKPQTQTIKIKKTNKPTPEPEEPQLVVGEAAVVDTDIESKPLPQHTLDKPKKLKIQERKKLFHIQIFGIETTDKLLEIWDSFTNDIAFNNTFISAEYYGDDEPISLLVGYFPTQHDAKNACFSYKSTSHTCKIGIMEPTH